MRRLRRRRPRRKARDHPKGEEADDNPMTTPAQCPFCFPAEDRIAFEDRLTRALWDAFPVSEGHLLLVPRRHVPTWFDATAEEKGGPDRRHRPRPRADRQPPPPRRLQHRHQRRRSRGPDRLPPARPPDPALHRRRPRPARRRETRHPRQGQLPGRRVMRTPDPERQCFYPEEGRTSPTSGSQPGSPDIIRLASGQPASQR